MAVIACLLLVGVFAGITALAGDATPEVKITSTNLAYNAEAKLVYNVEVDNITSPIGPSDITMLFWSEDPGTDASAAAASAVDLTEMDENLSGEYNAVMLSNGIAPQRMTQVIWAAAKYTADDNEYYSNVVRCSVIEYLSAMKLNGGTNAQEGLWAAMTDYITYAQEYLNYDLSKPGELVYVKVIGGTITGDNFTSGMYAKGSEITIKADTSNGDTFKRWRDAKYNAIADAGEEYTVTVNEDSIFRATFERISGLDKSVNITAQVQLPAGVVDSEGVINAYAYNLVPKLTNQGTVYFKVTDGENHPGVRTTNNVDTGVGSVQAVNSGVIDEKTYYFSHWIDEDGNKVSNTLAHIVDVGAKDRTFTAVYTETNPIVSPDNEWDKLIVDGSYTLTDSSTTAGSNNNLAKISGDYTEFGDRLSLSFDLNIKPYGDNATSLDTYHLKLSTKDAGLDSDEGCILFASLNRNSTNGYYITLSDRVGGSQKYAANISPYIGIGDGNSTVNIRFEIELIKNANGTYSNGFIHYIADGKYMGSSPVKNVDTFNATGDLILRFAANMKTIGVLQFDNLYVGTN